MSHDDAAYWRAVAMWMADVHAANAQGLAMLKRTPKSERNRQGRIAKECAALLMRQAMPSGGRSIEAIAARCENAAEMCAKTTGEGQ
jgi:hypothetical protein